MEVATIKFYFLTIYCVLLASSLIRCETNLEIFKNVGGGVTKLTSNLIEIPSGLNVTLVCKVPVKDDKEVKTYVHWFKMPSKSKFSSKVSTNFKTGATLRLDKLSLQDEGHYACVSLKHGLVEYINLIVTNGVVDKSSKITNSNNSRRMKFKREVLPGSSANRTVDFDLDDYRARASNLPTFDDTFGETRRYLDMLEKERKRKEQEEQRKRDEYFANINNDDDKSHSNSFGSSPLKPLLSLFGVLACLICVWGIIRCCREDNNSNSRRTGRTHISPQVVQSSNIYSTNRNSCGHSNCTTNYLLNPSGMCRFRDDASAPTDSLFEFPQIDMLVTNMTSMINGSTRRGDLDLSSNYNTSVHSSRHSLHEPTDPLFEFPQIDMLVTNMTSMINGSTRRGDLDLPSNYSTSVHSSRHSLHEPADALFEFPPNDMPITNMTSMINGSTRRGDLDLPPNYNTSVHSSGHSLHEPTNRLDGFSSRVLDAVDSKELALPPTYEEAVLNNDDLHKGHSSGYNHSSSDRYGSDDNNHSSTHHGYDSGDHNHSSSHGYDMDSHGHDSGSHSAGGGGADSGGGGDSGSRGDDSGGGGGDSHSAGGGGGDSGGGDDSGGGGGGGED